MKTFFISLCRFSLLIIQQFPNQKQLKGSLFRKLKYYIEMGIVKTTIVVFQQKLYKFNEIN